MQKMQDDLLEVIQHFSVDPQERNIKHVISKEEEMKFVQDVVDNLNDASFLIPKDRKLQ